MPSLVDNIKAVVTGFKVTLSNFLKKPVTVEYPWDQDEIPPISRGTLRMVDFHDAASISEKSAWYPGTRWAPCTEGCPAHTDARGYVTLAGESRWREGLETLRRTYPFVGTLGRVCPAPSREEVLARIHRPRADRHPQAQARLFGLGGFPARSRTLRLPEALLCHSPFRQERRHRRRRTGRLPGRHVAALVGFRGLPV